MRTAPHSYTIGPLFLATFILLFIPAVAQTAPHTLIPELRGKAPLPQDKRDPALQLDGFGEKQSIPVPPTMGQSDFDSMEERMQGMLLLAIGNDDVAEAKYLLNEGASPSKMPGSTDLTPLMVATSPEMVRALLDAGGDPMAIDDEGKTVLHFAVTQKRAPELIPLFASVGVSPDTDDDNKQAPIFMALDYFHEAKAFHVPYTLPGDTPVPGYDGPDPKATLQALVAVGGDINVRDQYGNTPLMLAVTRNDGDLLDLLLELGANKRLKGPGGLTAKEMAYELGHRVIFERLE